MASNSVKSFSEFALTAGGGFIDKDFFNAKANIKNVATNALVDAALKGTINLSNLSKAYPIKLDKPLTGILKADVTTKFDMKSVEANQYQNGDTTLISTAYAMGATGGAGGQAGGIAGFLPIIILFAIFYFLLIRPQQKKAKEHKEMA